VTSTQINVRIDDETVALLDELCAQRGNTRQQLIAHALDRVLAGHGLLDPAEVPKRRIARGDEPKLVTAD
jgi:hypothetical protein